MSNPIRTRRSPVGTTGRFARSGTTPRPRISTRRRTARHTAVQQRRGLAGGWLRRSQPKKQSPLKRVLSRAAGALPGLPKRRSTSSSRGGPRGRTRAGGLALFAGAAGLAFKNRDKLTSMARRNDSGSHEVQPAPAETPVAPVGDSHSPSGAGPTSSDTEPKSSNGA